jgi:hypothetical protein
VSDGGAIQAGSAASRNRGLKVDDLREGPAGIVQGRYDTVAPMALTLALGAASDRLCDTPACAAA